VQNGNNKHKIFITTTRRACEARKEIFFLAFCALRQTFRSMRSKEKGDYCLLAVAKLR